MIIAIILIVILSMLCCYAFISRRKVNTDIDARNIELIRTEKELKNKINELEVQRNEIDKDITAARESVDEKYNELNSLKCEYAKLDGSVSGLRKQEKELNDMIAEAGKNAEAAVKSQKDLATQAYEDHCKLLDSKTKEAEASYDEMSHLLKENYGDLMALLEKSYTEIQLNLRNETNGIRRELDDLRARRHSAIEAARREKEIETNKDDYRLNLDDKSIRDIKLLKSIQDEISNPIVINKIIWSNYYQPLAKIKFPKIIGKVEVCGIYKITNTETGEVYIGQSSGCCERWKTHCKNALGVGTNVGTNKLYTNMKKYGLYNFTFELLEECEPALLDEKEKYYIDFYDAYTFGLNATKGNG